MYILVCSLLDAKFVYQKGSLYININGMSNICDPKIHNIRIFTSINVWLYTPFNNNYHFFKD